jgi:hypothetical protein
MSRFQLSAGVRSATPLFVGLCGPSGCGKTFSALRLASGIRSVVGGELAVIDTEASRALHYADKFNFLHLPFGAPFSPDDYWEAISQCIKAGAKTIVIDSMSHEHEGPGGVLEQHDEEVQRLAKAWKTQESNVQFPAWAEPKAKRRRLVNNILQVRINLVLCFRAKKKVKMPTKEERQAGQRDPINLGWMPIAGEEYAYEMTALGVLPPGAKGVPDWSPLEPGSELVTKRPAQFEGVLTPGQQLSEEMGAAMARWAMGNSAPQNMGPRFAQLLALVNGAASLGLLEEVGATISSEAATATDPKGPLNEAEVAGLKRAYKVRKQALSTAGT